MKIRKISTIFLCLLMMATVFTVMPMNIGAVEDPPEDPPGDPPEEPPVEPPEDPPAEPPEDPPEEFLDEPEIPEEPGLEGEGEWWIDANGTYFEITNSEYLNITMTSSENVHVHLESIPRMISYHIEADCIADSTEIIISGFEASTTYYRYQESDLQEEFTTDENGSYSYTQDISTHHHVYIQESTSTLYIYVDTTLTSNIYESIYIMANDIILNGAGYTVQGSGSGYGIYCNGRSGVTLQNLNVVGFSYGIYLDSSTSSTINANTISGNYLGIRLSESGTSTITNNTVTGNSNDGIIVGSSSNSVIDENTVIGNGAWGIQLSSSGSSTMTYNTVTDNTAGITLWKPSTSTLRNNVLADNTRLNFLVRGSSVSDYLCDIDTTNTVNGKPIYYWVNRSYETVPSNAGYVGIINSNHITVQDLTLTNNYYAIHFAYTTDSSIQNVQLTDNFYNIYLSESNSNTVSGITVSGDHSYGIHLEFSDANTFTGNTLMGDNSGYGINMHDSNSNTFSSNTVSGYSNGIEMYNSDSTTLTGNTVSGNLWNGINQYKCDSTTLTGNTVSGSNYGITIYYSSNNILRNNIMTSNTYNFGIRTSPSLSHYIQDIDTSNTVDGKPIYYIVGASNLIIDSSTNAGYVGIVNSDHITVQDVVLSNNRQGIIFVNTSDSTIQNVEVSGTEDGIILYYSNNSLLYGNSVSGCQYGISLESSNGNNINDNTASGNDYGIRLSSSSSNSVSYNLVSGNNYYGIIVSGGNNNIVSENTASDNINDGIYMSSSNIGNIISGNTVSGNTNGIRIGNFITVSGNIVSGNTYGIYLYYSDSNTISGNTISGNSYGIYIYRYSESNTISGNMISDNSDGIYLYYSYSNFISENTISSNYRGIFLYSSARDNIINGNSISSNSYGIYQRHAYRNTMSGNNISGNYNIGIYLYDNSELTIISGNTVQDNYRGIYISYYCDDNIIKSGNTISGNTYGIRIYYSNSNTIYHNNIEDNTYQAYDSNPVNNDWYHPELLRGNHWSDYTGADDGSGTGKHAIAGDGIGDTKIPHPWSNYDYYPLMDPFVNTAPTISSFTATTPAPEGSPVTFTVIASDLEGDELTYSFDFDGDGTFDLTGSSNIVSHIYADDFQCTARVRVSDEVYSVEATTTIQITNVNPTVDAGADLTIDEGYPFPGTITFSDPGFDYTPWGTVEDFTATIDWGDSLVEPVGAQETPGSEGVPTQGSLLTSHPYADNGVYTVNAEVCDDNGGCGSDSLTVTVNNAPPEVQIVRMRPPTEGEEVFLPSTDVLAQFEFNGDVTDSSGNDRDAVLLGGEFVPTEFGQGLYVTYETDPSTGEILPMGIDWSAFAGLLNHPYTIEIVLTPDYSYKWSWQKIFGFDDDHDNGWYYYRYGFQAWPNPEFGWDQILPMQRHYLAIVSTSPHSIDVYLQGEYLGSTDASFTAPPSQAIFFRDDTETERDEQLRATVEALRISGTTRSLSEIGAIQQRLGSIPPVVPKGSTIIFKGTFTDPGILDTHTAEWIIDSDSIPGIVSEEGGSGEVIGQQTFDTAGVYPVVLRVTDKDGGVGEANTIQGVTAMVVVYDPEDSFVTGGGWINSPPGAYIWDQSLEGKATFGFVSKYQKGAAIPTGNTEFHFNAADLTFYSTSYQWLVIAGARAQYKGSGTLIIKDKWGGPWDREYECGFMLTAIDGQRPGGGGKDKFRIKIWHKTYGYVIYDNQMGDDDEAPVTTEIGGGSIQIKKA